jgi:hypothetical protein
MENYQNTNSKRKWLVIVSIIFFLVVGFWLFESFIHRGLVKTTIVLLPEDSSLTIDGKPSKSGSIYLKSGKHTLVASREYFDSDVKKINTDDIVSSEKIYLLPKAESSQAKKWLIDHPDVQQEREVAGGSDEARNQRLISKNYPIISQLPYENEHFKIDYSFSSDGKPNFTITLYGILNKPDQYPEYLRQLKQYKQEALAYLSKNKVAPSDYKITYLPNDPGQ